VAGNEIMGILEALHAEIRKRGGDPDALKTIGAFDPNDPSFAAKLPYYRRLIKIIQSRFEKQATWIRHQLELFYSNHPQKAAITPPIDWIDSPALWNDPEFMADLVIVLRDAALSGVDLFRQASAIGVDYTLVNSGAVQWAQNYAFDLVKGIDATTREALQQSISAFANTPGMTIGDAMNMMPFDAVRAQMVATTEITRAYARANQLAGEKLKQEFPDVKVVKIWSTNNDDRVCDICGPLNTKEVDIDEDFAPDISAPPAHVNCRCWMSTRTRING